MNLHREFKYCTLCLSKERNLLDAFDHNERDIELPGVIRELLQFEVVRGGGIPWKICRNCIIKLKYFNHFKNHATKCKEYLEYTLFYGRQQLDSTLEDGLPVTKTENIDLDEMQSNKSFTVEDGIVPKIEAMEDVPDQTEESHPRQTATPVLKPVEVFVNVDVPLVSGEMLEERDPLGGEDGDVKPSALITMLDEGVAREEDSTSYPLPTRNSFTLGIVKQEVGDDIMETSAMTIVEGSPKESSNVVVMSCGDLVRAPVDEDGERIGGFQETMEAEKNSEGLIGTGHHSSERLQQETAVPEAAICHWFQRRLSSNSQNDDEGPNEGMESIPENTSWEQSCEISEALTQRNAGMRIESKENSNTLLGDISNGPLSIDDESEGDYFHCNECGKAFRSKSLLRKHVKWHWESVVLECVECRMMFSKKSDYDRHKSVQHGSSISKRIPQRGVAVDLSGESKGKGKIRERKPAICEICNIEFSYVGNLTIHMKSVHLKECNFLCDICGKAFRRKDALKTHMQYHNGAKSHTCSTCQKGFYNSNHLKAHILSVHEMEKPHTCGECGKTFSQKFNLKIHMLVHTGERPHTCNICSKTFSYKQVLKMHMVVHTGERPHTCNICSKTFSYKQVLKMHMLLHTKERPHNCNICSKTFREKHRLTLHMLTHAEEKPHACNLCSRSFKHKAYLKRHMATHARTLPHPCDLCTKTFIHRSDLHKHQLEHMGMKYDC